MHPLRRDDVKIQIGSQEKRPGDTSSVVRSKASHSVRESQISHQTRRLLEGSSNGTVFCCPVVWPCADTYQETLYRSIHLRETGYRGLRCP